MKKQFTRGGLALALFVLTSVLVLNRFGPLPQTGAISDRPVASKTASTLTAQPPPVEPSDQSGIVPPEAPVVAMSESPQSSPNSTNPLPAFRDWLARYAAETDSVAKAQLAAEGEALARDRRAAMANLIETDPQRALAEALTYSQRQQLPESVTRLLEQSISGRGNLDVLGVLPEAGAENQMPGIVRTARMDGQDYRAFVYGRRLSQPTAANIPMHGIAIGDAIALSASPVRVLDIAEAIARAGEVAPEDAQCPVSGNPVSVEDAEAVVDVGGQVRILCNGGHIEVLEGELLAAEGAGAGGEVTAASTPDPWSQGAKTLLYIRVKFSDQTSDPQTLADSQNMMNSVNSFFIENSYDTTTITPTFTPVYTLPGDTAYYNSNGYYLLRSDALNIAKTNGFDYVNYNLDAVRYNGGPGSFSGAAYVRARGCWLKSSSAGVAAHEFGHNYGLYHANSWNPTDESPIGPGTWQEYGDSFDTMGSAAAGANHFSPRYKSVLNWIAPDGFLTASSNGTYRIYAHDFITSSNFIRGLRVPRSSTKNYWVDFRQKHTGNTWLMNGAGIRRADNSNNNNPGCELLDTTPGSPDGKTDSGLLIGRTFSDASAGVHVTPIGKGATTPQSLDVVVNFGTFPGNGAPTLAINASSTSVPTGTTVNFTATASDPNGDTLAYYWDFDDKTYGLNTPTPSKSWSTAGEYVVRCVVSDMKGGTASRFIVVTVGSPNTFRISGRVTDLGGNPVEGARVHNGQTGSAYRGCFTDSDGNYTIARLAAGNHTISAAIYGSATSASGFSNPVTVGPSKSDINFVSVPQTYGIAGRVTDGGVGVAGVQVSDGFRIATTTANGDYVITNVPNGSYTLTATKSGYTFTPSGWANPVTVSDVTVTGRDFITPTYTVSGEITGVSADSAITVTDGYRTTSSYKQGGGKNAKNVYSLSGVPAGSWNLRAVNGGSSFSPANFSNPLTVSGNTSSRNFALDATTTYAISGTITLSGVGLPSVTVTAGSRSSVTDSRGGFYINGLANGSYSVVPSLSGYGFSPANTTVNISGASVSGQNFAASQVVTPTVTLTASDADASEPGSNTGRFTITRSGSTAVGLTVNYTVSGTATAGVDYTALPGSVTIPAGTNSAHITVTPLDDTTPECAETVIATLAANAAYTVGSPNSATVTITDNDLPSVSVVALTSSIWENSGGSASFRITRNGCLNNALTVNYTLAGSAANGSDYQSLSTSVIIPASATFANIVVTPINDSAIEGDETVVLTLAANANYAIGAPASATITILDDDTNHAPEVNAGSPQTVSILGLANLSGTVTDDGLPGSGLTYSWTKVSGPGTVVAGTPNAKDTSVSVSMSGVYVFRLTVSDGELSGSGDVAVTVTAADPAKVLNAVNAGGAAHTDSQGLAYRADQWFTGGDTSSSAQSIAATADAALYQSRRNGDFSYSIPVSGGNRSYLLALKFAEPTAGAAGQRVFDVLVDGQLVLDNLDLHAQVGANTAFDAVLPINATGDVLSVEFRTEAGSPLPATVNAIVVGAAQVLPPAAPAALTATAVSGSQIQLAWSDQSANESSFQIEASLDGANYSPVATVSANTTSYTHTGLSPTSTYYYRVRACNSAGCSSAAEASAETLGAPPAAPSNLTLVAASASQINVYWADNSSNETGFAIEQSLNGSTWEVVGLTAANQTSFAATGLAKNTRYYYRVRAFNDLGDSAYSNVANTRTKPK